MSRAGYRRRLAAGVAAVAAAVLTAAGTVSPALAATATGPAMDIDGNDVNIAVQGPDNSLMLYWAVNGSSAWNTETVAGPNTTYSAPSMVVNGGTVNIAAAGPNSSLLFYWTFNGSGTWNTETVGGDLTAAQGLSLAVDGNTFYIAVVHPLSAALDVWYDTIGTGTWHQVQVAQDMWGYTPAITANGSNINISAIGQNGGIDFYWGSLGTWHAETVTGAGTSLTAPWIAVNGNTVTIAATSEQGQLLFYYAVTGTGTWRPAETVAAANTTSSAPSIVADAPADTTAITAVSPGGRLDFYWQTDGTSPWHLETLPGSGIE